MATPACLVTSTPDFAPPEQTAPFLIAATADPSTRSVLVINSAQFSQKDAVDFSAQVLSEDAGSQVLFQLYIDYGFPDNPEGLPYRLALPHFAPLEPSTIGDTSRAAKAHWFPKSNDPGFGCHTVTLIASHAWDQSTGCPARPNDATQITWQVFRCDPASNHPCDPTDFTDCQAWTKSCSDVTSSGAVQ